MNTRRRMARKLGSFLCPEPQDVLNKNMLKASTLSVKQVAEDIFEVFSWRVVQVHLT